MNSAVRLYLGDCLAFLKTLPEGCVDAVVTDPPYGMQWDTNCRRFSGGLRGHRQPNSGRDWGAAILGDSQAFDPAPWLAFPKVVLWGCNHYASRLPIGTTLIWVKRNEQAFGSFLSDAEMAWMKGGKGIYLHKDLSMNREASRRLHPNQKPLGLLSWCLQRLKLPKGATIFDPYMGSGSTAIAALRDGFNFIGCEIDPTYFAIAEQRIAKARHDTPLFAEVP